MELIKWQSVIVEWVNCLNLSKPVQAIGDLKNEDFFRKLLLFITPPDQNESLDRSVSLTDFLKKHYPAYSLEEEPTLIQDDVEICNISSLLLHFCCLIDGREELTTPLCKELNTTYQFHIKSFLEDLQDSNIISRELLNDAITNSTKYSTPTKFLKTPLDSPKLVGNTPLLEFLKTPLKKQQVYDSHKKEIKQLQAQLDLERFEKADLQEELNLQYEKNTKLDKIISNKQSEISRMRSELLALESRTPPSNTKTDGRLENKRLRDEIASLEKYVEILHKEQEEIQNERDKAREKLRKVEETCNDWQTRALNSERQCSMLSEETVQQQSELIQLREKCEELSSILQEVNARNICDESYEIEHMPMDIINRSGPIDYDNLAHTVIDVQLTDAQEENKNLRKQITELEGNSTELTIKMNKAQLEITKLIEENTLLVDTNKKLKQKISETEEQFEKCQQTLKLTEEEKENLNTCIAELKKKLSETKFNLTFYENECESLVNDLAAIKQAYNNATEQLNQQINNFNHLLSEKSKLHSQLDESTQKLMKFESENEFLKDFFNKFNSVFEIYITKFESELKQFSKVKTGNDNISKLQQLVTVLTTQNSKLQDEVTTLSKENGLMKEFMDKFNKILGNCLIKFEAELKIYMDQQPSAGRDNMSQFQGLLTMLECKLEHDAQKYKKLQDNSNSLLSRIKSLQDEVTTLYNNEVESQREKSDLKICLEESKSKLRQLDDAINSNKKIILTYKSNIEEKCTEISSLKNTVINKDIVIEELNKDKDHLTASLQTVESKLTEETRALDLSNKELNTLLNSFEEAEAKLLQFAGDIAKFESTIQEKINEISSLNDVIANNNKTIEDADKANSDLSSSLETVQNEVLEEKRLKDIANKELVKMKKSLQAVEAKILVQNALIEERSKQICELQETLDSQNKNMEHINNELLEEKRLNDIANKELLEMKKSLQAAQSKVLEQKTFIEERSKQICELQEILDSHEKNMELLNNEKSNLISRLESTENMLSEEKSAKEQTETEIQYLKNNLQVFEEKMQLMESYKSTMDYKSKEFDDVVANKDKLINDLENEKCSLTSSLQATESNLQAEKHATKIARSEIENFETCLQQVKLKIEDLTVEIDNNNKLRSGLENEKRCLTHSLQTVENNLQTEKHATEIAQTEISNLKSKLLEVESKLQNLVVVVDSNNKLINDLEHEKFCLTNSLQTAESDLQAEKHTTEIAQTEISNLKSKLLEVEAKLRDLFVVVDNKNKLINDLEHEKFLLTNSLQTAESNLLAEKHATEIAQTEISNLKSNLQEVESKLQDLNIVVDNHNKLINDLEHEKIVLTNNLQVAESNFQAEKHNREIIQIEASNLECNLQEVESNLKDLIVVNDNNKKLIELYKAAIKDKSTEMTNAEASRNKYIEAINEEKCNLLITLHIVEKKLAAETHIKEIAEKDCQLIKIDFNEKEKHIKNLESHKTDLENNVDSLNKVIRNEKNSKTKLEEKCSKLQTIITEVEQQMQDLLKEKSKLNHQLETVNKNLNELQIKNNDLTKSISERDNHLKNLERQKLKLNTKLEELEKELQNAEESKDVLKSKFENMVKCFDDKLNHVSNLELEKINIQKKFSNMQEELLERTKQKDEVEIQLQEITKLLEQKENCIEYLKRDKNTIEQQMEMLNSNLTTQEIELSNKITDHLNRNHELQTKVDTFNQNFNMINIEISTIVNMLKNVEDFHIELEQVHTYDSFGELSKTISNLKNNICSLIFEKRRLDSETSTFQQQISDLEQLKLSVEKENAKLSFESQKTINKLTEECKVLQSDKERYKSRVETYRKKLVKLEKSVSDTEKLMSEHSQEMRDLQLERSKLLNQIHDLEEEIKQYKLQKSNMNSDLLAIKTELKETIISYQRSRDSNKDMEQKYLQLSEDKTVLAVKLDQVTDECCKLKASLSEYTSKHSQKLQEIEDVKSNLSSHEKIVLELEEKIKAKDMLVTDLTDEKKKFESQLSDLTSTFNNHLEQKRNEISDEMELKIQNAEQTIIKMNANFNDRLEEVNKKRLEVLETKKHLENEVQSLTKQLNEISADKNNLITFCKESQNKIHSIYTIVFENKEDKQIIERFNKLQQENQFDSLQDEKDIVGEEYDIIANEITVLKKAYIELSNYETLKFDYAALKDKHNQLITEKESLESKLSEITNKLSDVQLENTRYQKQLSEKEIDFKSTKDRYVEEIDLMKATCANWQKLINENDTEHKKLQNDHLNLKEKYDTEFEVLQNSKIKLERTVFELEQQIIHNQNAITERDTKYEDLNNKYQTATQRISTLDPEILLLQDKINDYKKIINDLENDNIKLSKNFNDLTAQHKIFIDKCKQEHVKTDKDEVVQLRSAYSDLLTENSRLQLDCTVLKKTVEDRNNQLSNLTLIKDSYEKLLEENNKVNMELDTLRYKRTRDKEEFKRIVEEGNTKSNKEIQEVRSEYEEKLKKMKEKIVKLYREEVEKEKKKVCTLQQGQAEETISTLKSQLWMTGNKYVDLKKENEKLREQLLKGKDHQQLGLLEITRGSDIHGSRDSVCSLRERKPIREIEERRTSTLPRDMKTACTPQTKQINIIEECVTISRKRRSITAGPKHLDPGLKMEDEEGEFFNNTYLADLKAGRCIVSDRDSISSTSSRLSELQLRNSLCPPHLKSSYPAETQFTSPGQCKEEDIKMGTVDLDDSMSSSLLPGEKPRTKKDWGQTLYKKPGPPTPSKNGGRLSLQGNEVHPREVLREHNPGRTTSTPSRIKALFSRSGASSRDSENVTPRGPTKRRSIFRR